jgi:DNA ligase-associated metallophosphoesterase
MSKRCDVDWNGIRLSLLAERAVFRADSRALFVADLHLGKPEHFRAGGAPVPEEVTAYDLLRLATLIDRAKPERLIILGDLFHARLSSAGDAAERFASWRRDRPSLRVALVRGNHDRWADGLESEFGIEDLGYESEDSGLFLVHDPADAPTGAPTLAGHVHPALRLGGRTGRGPAAVRSPCFWFAERVGVLPAFGRFTGARLIHPEPHHRAFITNGEAVVDVSAAFGRPRSVV